MTQTEIIRAEKKIDIAIDKLVDLQDMGFGNDTTMRILEMLNKLRSEVWDKRGK